MELVHSTFCQSYSPNAKPSRNTTPHHTAENMADEDKEKAAKVAAAKKKVFGHVHPTTCINRCKLELRQPRGRASPRRPMTWEDDCFLRGEPLADPALHSMRR